jgi:carbonic anhydrase
MKPLASPLSRRYVSPGACARLACLMTVAMALAMALAGFARADGPPSEAAQQPGKASTARPAPGSTTSKDVATQLREAIDSGQLQKKKLTLTVNGQEQLISPIKKEEAAAALAKPAAPAPPGGASSPLPRTAPPVKPQASRQYIRDKATSMAGHPATSAAEGHGHQEAHWSYEGEAGPQAWGKLKPEFNLCANGKRQSPIHIEDSTTLQGPAEPLQFNYQASSGTVVNNGHTIQVDVSGDNAITVRGSTYKLLQFHFHNPSEERVNFKNFAMVAHLVHKNDEGQLAVVAVLLDPGVANALINKVWTYMPLDSGDRVRMPAGLIDMNELLPKDQRYYQFMGSLTTPPCSEGVLWMVLKQAMPVSREQLKLFAQLFPNNARPVQPLNGRAVRDAQ